MGNLDEKAGVIKRVDPMSKCLYMQAPELNSLLDISKIAAYSKVSGKWMAIKMPIISGVEFSINKLYDDFDFHLSYKRIVDAK